MFPLTECRANQRALGEPSGRNMNRDLSQTVFGGRQNYEYWQTIFETGSTRQGQQVLPGPLNIMDMIRA
jgi:hypothetical protein